MINWPGQTVLCIGQLYWTKDITFALINGLEALKSYMNTCNDELNNIVELVRGKLSTQNRITLGKFFFFF